MVKTHYVERNEAIIALRRSGLTPAEIYDRMRETGITKNAIIGVLGRAGLTEWKNSTAAKYPMDLRMSVVARAVLTGNCSEAARYYEVPRGRAQAWTRRYA